MSTRLLLLLCLVEQILAKKPPDVDCLIVHQEHVHCFWNKEGTPEANYTFTSWFQNKHDKERPCADYVLDNNITIGCKQPCNKTDKFLTFYTVLTHGNETFKKDYELKRKVKLNPPINVTAKNGSDFNLWFYWNQTSPRCVENKVRFKINDKEWDYTDIPSERMSYCINLPSSNSRYEFQVQSKIADGCGNSDFWSDWSEPVVWGFNNSTDTNTMNTPMPVLKPVLYAVAAIVLILLVIMLIHHERLKIILIPVVPKPQFSSPEFEDWFLFSKGLMKEGFKANYNEQACPVREYSYVSCSDSNSFDSSDLTITTDQTDCCISVAMSEHENLSASFYSSSESFEENDSV